ncbi:MAG TPA: hypothetical protein VGP69_17565 [Gaiellaceae bacterium]|jgi:hypothetical protein|nr:hypothetical protein [Gaiellaceae bacterium]
MNLRWAAAGLMGLVLGCSCGSSNSATSAADASVKHDLLRGVAVIRATQDRKRLETQLGGIVASLRGERGSTTAVERARKVALAGFQLTRKGVRSQLDFSENDRGEVAAAARDARRADRYLGSGADRLRLAGLALGIQIGMLDGY